MGEKREEWRGGVGERKKGFLMGGLKSKNGCHKKSKIHEAVEECMGQ